MEVNISDKLKNYISSIEEVDKKYYEIYALGTWINETVEDDKTINNISNDSWTRQPNKITIQYE